MKKKDYSDEEIKDEKDYSDEEIKQMTWQKKPELIQKDPVPLCNNYLSTTLLKAQVIELEKLLTPHIHGLFWIQNAPEYVKDTDEAYC